MFDKAAEEKGLPAQRLDNDGSISVDAGILEESRDLAVLGYRPELVRNRSMWTLLFQSLAIAAIPYGLGSPLISAIYGGGQLSIFLGWILACLLQQCVAMSLGELASQYPTSAEPYYWSFQLAKRGRVALSFVTGWTWLIGNWTIALSVNFGFASLMAGAISTCRPNWTASSWELLLIFYAITISVFVVCTFFNRWLPVVDTIAATWTVLSTIIILVSLSVTAKAGRHDVAYALGNFDPSLSGWGGFSFCIGLLPAVYPFCAIGLISSTAEECTDPAVRVPKAMSLAIPVGSIAGLFFVLPICFTLPPLTDILIAPGGQALPYIFARVMGSRAGAMGLIGLVLVLCIMCSISITVAASRCTWAFARDSGVPFGQVWAKVHPKLNVPVNALVLMTVVQLLLGLINLGSSSTFTAFISVGVIGLAVSYAIPIGISLCQKRKRVHNARWHWSPMIGFMVNIVSIAWIAFQLVIFSMPTVLPVTASSMNYAIVLFLGFLVASGTWYAVYARQLYTGPPESDGLADEGVEPRTS